MVFSSFERSSFIDLLITFRIIRKGSKRYDFIVKTWNFIEIIKN